MLFTVNPQGKKLFYYILGILLAFNIYFVFHSISPQYNLSTCSINLAKATAKCANSLYTSVFTFVSEIPSSSIKLFNNGGSCTTTVPTTSSAIKATSIASSISDDVEKAKFKIGSSACPVGRGGENGKSPKKRKKKSKRLLTNEKEEALKRRTEKQNNLISASLHFKTLMSKTPTPSPPPVEEESNFVSSIISMIPLFVSLMSLYRFSMITFYRKYFKLFGRNLSLFIFLTALSALYTVCVYNFSDILRLNEEDFLSRSMFFFTLFISGISVLIGIPKNTSLSTAVHPYVSVEAYELKIKRIQEERKRKERERLEIIKKKEIKMESIRLQEERTERAAVMELKGEAEAAALVAAETGSSSNSRGVAGQSPLPLKNWGAPQTLKARALHSYTAVDGKNEISLVKGKEYIVSDCRGNWWKAKDSDRSGYVPSNYLTCEQRATVLKDWAVDSSTSSSSTTTDVNGSIPEVKKGDVVEVLEVHDSLVIIRAVIASLNMKRIGSIPKEYINLL